MPAVSKAEFSRILGVSKPRVSQYIAHGLPVLPSGKIDLDVATKWVAENFGHDERQKGRGSDRAKAIVKSKPPAPVRADPVTVDPLRVTVASYQALCREVGRIAAECAVKAGAPMRVAWALNTMVGIELAHYATNLLPPGELRNEIAEGDWPWQGQGPGDGDPNWKALAGAAGEQFDEDAWEHHLAGLPWSTAPVEAR